MIDPRVSFEVSRAERTLLEHAESHLLGCDRTAVPEPQTQYREGGS